MISLVLRRTYHLHPRLVATKHILDNHPPLVRNDIGERTMKPSQPSPPQPPSEASPSPSPSPSTAPADDYLLFHPVYTKEEMERVVITHRKVESLTDALAYSAVTIMRFSFDTVTGYSHSTPFSAEKWLTRIVFLETVAGVPGFVAAMHRHLASLRNMERDHGYIHTLLEEAENERMHLLTALQLKQPSKTVRALVIVAQGVLTNFLFLAYFVMPTWVHKFVGYLEEEAVKTYTHLIKDIDEGHLPEWAQKEVPPIAINYWRLPASATMRDLFLAIRCDEANHRNVNHHFSEIIGSNYKTPNPIKTH